MTYEVQTQANGRFVAIVNGQPLRNSKGALRTFKYAMEAERAAYHEAQKKS